MQYLSMIALLEASAPTPINLLLAAITGLAATVGVLFKMWLSQQEKMADLLLQQGKMLGETTALLKEIPEFMRRQQDERRELINDLKNSMAGCARNHDRLDDALDRLKHSGDI